MEEKDKRKRKSKDKTVKQLRDELKKNRNRILLLEKERTDRKKREEKLKSDRDRLQGLMDGLNRTEIGVDIVNTDYEILFQNKVLKKRFGDCAGKLCYEEYTKRKKPCDPCPMEKAVKSGKARKAEMKGADERDYELLSAPLPNPEGTVDKVIEVVRDITERKRLESRMSQTFDALNSSINSIILCNLAGEINFVNPAFLRMFEYKNKKEVIGKNAAELFASEKTKIFADVKAIIDETKGETEEFLARRKNGTNFPVEVSSSVVTDKEGKPVGRMASFVDITKRNKAEEELKAANQQLQASNQQLRAAEQQLRVSNQQLDASNKQLRASEQQLRSEIKERKKNEEKIKRSLREKEVMLQEIHHRVKNNMQIISSLLKLQYEHIEDEQMLKTLKSSQDRIRSMALIHEKLYQSEDFARVDFAKYVKSLLSYLFGSFGISQRVIQLNVKITDVFLELNTAIPCALIINELVSNSLKHGFPDRKKGEIIVSMHPVSENKIELTVSDNGVGLPEQVDLKSAKSLGLHLVNMLAEDQLHGEVSLNREKGTHFCIQFEVMQ